MRFLRDGKRIPGFCDPESEKGGANLTNVIRLRLERPERVTPIRCRSMDVIPKKVNARLREVANP